MKEDMQVLTKMGMGSSIQRFSSSKNPGGSFFRQFVVQNQNYLLRIWTFEVLGYPIQISAKNGKMEVIIQHISSNEEFDEEILRRSMFWKQILRQIKSENAPPYIPRTLHCRILGEEFCKEKSIGESI
jgi:hypothetical protein